MVDLSKLEKGDLVKSCLIGWGEIVNFSKIEVPPYGYNHCFDVSFKIKNGKYIIRTFFMDGKRSLNDLNPEIIDSKKRKKFMIVNDWKITQDEEQSNNSFPSFYKYLDACISRDLIKTFQKLLEFLSSIEEHDQSLRVSFHRSHLCNSFVLYNKKNKKYEVASERMTSSDILTLFMNRELAEKLADALNNSKLKIF